MIKGGGKKVEAILKRQSHYREEAAIAPSESMPPSGHGWGAQTAACCQHRLRALPETSHSSAPGGLWGHGAAPALSHRRRYFIPEAHGWMAEQQLGKGSDAHTHTHTHTPSPALPTHWDYLLLSSQSLPSPSEDKGRPPSPTAHALQSPALSCITEFHTSFVDVSNRIRVTPGQL